MGASTAAPERTCVCCGTKAPKIDLIRLTLGPDGPQVSRSGSGRGAYVHQGCAGELTARGGLARALRSGLDPREIARLRTDIEGKR